MNLFKKHPILLIPVLLLSLQPHAQVLKDKATIQKERGAAVDSLFHPNGSEILLYEEELKSRSGEVFIRWLGMFFEKDICTALVIIEPISEVSANIDLLNRDMVWLDEYRWKDYENELLFELETGNSFCIITVWQDNGNQKIPSLKQFLDLDL